MATATPPPQIYRVVSRPLCSELRQHIKPAIGMMLENDGNIKKSPQLFKDYNIGALYGSDPSSATQGGQQQLPTETGSNASQNMALLGLEGLIRPIANNIIAIQTMLDSPELRVGTGREDDDKRLQDIRKKLLQALATQNASLDIISGFVDTQQMADLQHAGQTYISSMSQPDTEKGTAATPAPDPLTSSPNYAGLPPNPYSIDLATIPGLTLGYNPVTRLIDALHWTIDQTSARENEAATAVMSGAALCSEVPLTSPPP
ncbi:MAG: hypothetical protein WAK16_13205 [Candidatus Cybelea sp.]|jgi:hypothetical protein